MPGREEFTVKGTWFVVARDYVHEAHGAEAVTEVAKHLAPEHAAAWSDPLPGLWYPELALLEALRGLHQGPSAGSAADFENICTECTRRGVSRFFSAVLAMSKPHLVLRGVPTMWKALRRGPARVEVHRSAHGTDVHYLDFPFFSELLYRRMTVGSLSALVERCRGGATSVRVGDWSDTHLIAHVDHGAD